MQATTEPTPLQPTAFADWYRTAHPGLVEAVLRAVRPPALAVDAVDEAFARAFARWDRVHAMRSPAGWVYRVAVHEARRQLRRGAREEAVLALAPVTANAPPPGGEAWLLVADLPPRQRAAVVLRHVAGLTEAEVGVALGVTRSTVSSSLASAYKNLAGELADEDRSDAVPDVPATDPQPSGPEARSLDLAVATSCGPDGCDVEPLGGGVAVPATYGDAVRDVVKVRPGDLVAVDPAGPTIVWRWWTGVVESVDGDHATVSRNVTQASPAAARRAAIDVDLPPDLVGGVDVGERVWFGVDAGRTVVVAVAGPEAAGRAGAHLPAVREALG